ncbi:Uncharacterised protein [Slackia heliotrinireducens]|uniref:Uncharacterized protein n=1 Tax=Slackia heliotrinireducens (strain ATCC 29202 / DSM 20476 / NCTC 11029 / RHS 1) TaxID=471855 RepID=C7N1V1_SLAHD|nr:hypothetical protein [Slackia heliotrinireducens]ACV23392.1 hypothetical protein Shel_23830 [Slackia heliotrinireducens DSM 20476]VEH02674.1 Uncharacterised protein [Slackia heliotrinireducens]
MANLSPVAIDVLVRLVGVVTDYQSGRRENLTVDAVELNGMLGGRPRVPFGDKEALKDAVAWCRKNNQPLLPALVVIDKGYRKPDSGLLKALYGSKSITDAMSLWEQEIQTIGNLSAGAVAQFRNLIPAKEPESAPRAVRKPAERKTSAPRTAARREKTSAVTSKREAAGVVKQGSAVVTVQSIDAAAFKECFAQFCQYVEDADPGAPLFDNVVVSALEESRLTARDVWLGDLDIPSWTEDMVGTGALVAKIQATIDDDEAPWSRFEGRVPNIAAVLRRKDRQRGNLLFEGPLMSFYKDEMSAEAFLKAMKSLFVRYYGMVSHLLFLKDAQAYVPVDSEAAEAGFRKLGMDLSLSGACTWPSYSRFLGHLGRIQKLLAEEGHPATLQNAYTFLQVIGEMK